MEHKRYVRDTARSTSWATPSAYEKHNDWEPGQTAGQSSPYEGHRPDALRGSRWGGDGRILLMFQTALDLQPGTLELCQAGLQK